MGVEKINTEYTHRRKERESYWIFELQCLAPRGLNLDEGVLWCQTHSRDSRTLEERGITVTWRRRHIINYRRLFNVLYCVYCSWCCTEIEKCITWRRSERTETLYNEELIHSVGEMFNNSCNLQTRDRSFGIRNHKTSQGWTLTQAQSITLPNVVSSLLISL